MKISILVVGVALVATALLAATPAGSAVATCTVKDKGCPALVCIGYNSQTGWQRCYVEIYCLHDLRPCGPCDPRWCDPWRIDVQAVTSLP